MNIDNNAIHALINRAQSTKSSARADESASFATALAENTQEANRNTTVKPLEKYDFSNMTPQALHETMSALFQSGQVSFDETLSFLGLIPSPLDKVNYDGKVPTSYYQPVNFFAQIQERIEGALSRSEKQSAERLQQAADTLRRIQGQVRINSQT
ncbi:hypothetical protein CKO12_00660 [Chromatium okenii]|uniref:hypothetical protein n=1 Tax=Chromatium okenii TaxID=61644 RepID=UPI001907CDF2|nr:hypothetical protein [Chromatium okenii]MBK1640415.1 hypothetical protein [Chromatium okenii]